MAKDRNKKTGGTMETVRTIIYALLIAGVVRTFLFQPFNIPSGSMIPTLLIGDYLFVSKFSYGYSRFSLPLGLGFFEGRIFGSAPDRGDVAVFRHPPTNREDFIKRIVGMPGDRIQMAGGRLNINGQEVLRRRIDDHISRDRGGQVRRVPQYEETLPNGRTYIIRESFGDRGPSDNTREFVVPAGNYFAMGDNRDDSNDSRGWGFVPADNLIGRAEILFFSTDGTAGWLQPWRWIQATRFNRIFDSVD
ncbi:MAG: signal peptidase I [Rhodospirillaceae bacterium]|jgi:signal peptidase I|nr:signal peptidase I [Rhodospirillaceae bacterium]MBT3809823.1 signal peptidase I [Rhodospirillaceae bacterium]MBT3929618.1 signal peptidase I [Rhodospirillaceae bacterium]MBT4772034.1 signal peptidase I [Rhodospirillaceae bacterium]MBT5357225.1 signal peptidase I [Rhodospirillaceae bacterium]